MKKKSTPAKKGALKKTAPKKKTTVAKKAAPQKAAPKKRIPKKAAPKKANRNEAVEFESFRPICITDNVRLDDRCMSKSEAFEIAQAHRRDTHPHHSVDIESC